MGDLTLNFSRHEFACKCGCGFDDIDLELVKILQQIRDHFDQKIEVTSGCRCKTHNEKVGGGTRSQHLLGKAADIVVENTPAQFVQELADDMDVKGLGYYNSFTHIDTRERHARWNG